MRDLAFCRPFPSQAVLFFEAAARTLLDWLSTNFAVNSEMGRLESLRLIESGGSNEVL